MFSIKMKPWFFVAFFVWMKSNVEDSEQALMMKVGSQTGLSERGSGIPPSACKIVIELYRR